jgi:hypothetical protein
MFRSLENESIVFDDNATINATSFNYKFDIFTCDYYELKALISKSDFGKSDPILLLTPAVIPKLGPEIPYEIKYLSHNQIFLNFTFENAWKNCRNAILKFKLEKPLDCATSFEKNQTIENRILENDSDYFYEIVNSYYTTFNTNFSIQFKVEKYFKASLIESYFVENYMITGNF